MISVLDVLCLFPPKLKLVLAALNNICSAELSIKLSSQWGRSPAGKQKKNPPTREICVRTKSLISAAKMRELCLFFASVSNSYLFDIKKFCLIILTHIWFHKSLSQVNNCMEVRLNHCSLLLILWSWLLILEAVKIPKHQEVSGLNPGRVGRI